MHNNNALDRSDYEWHPFRVAFPRIGLLVNRHGIRTRLIWPGYYLVRKSRTFSKWVYRPDSSDFHS